MRVRHTSWIIAATWVMVALAPSVRAQGGPGGIGSADGASSLRLWLRADAGVESDVGVPALDSEKVMNWLDQSGHGNHFSQATFNSRPNLATNFANAQPAMRFDATDADGVDFLRSSHFMDFSDFTIFIVGKKISGTGMAFSVGTHNRVNIPRIQLRYHNNVDQFWAAVNDQVDGNPQGFQTLPQRPTTVWHVASYRLDDDNFMMQYNGLNVFNNTNTAYTNPTFNTGNAPTIGKDSQIASYNLTGDLAEIIIYDRPLNSAERLIVENALAAKYDFELISPNNKYDGASSAKGDYDLDVFGFGRIDASNMVTSGSVGGLGLTAINDTLDNGEWLLAGHKTPVNSLVLTDLPGDETARWERVWYMDQTGSVDALLSFDFAEAGLPVPDPETTFSLLYSPENAFSWSVLGGRSPLLPGDAVAFSVPGGLLADGYYTLGYNPIPEPTTGLLLVLSATLLGLRRRR